MLDITAISKTFHPGTPNARQALRQLSLHLEDGEFATIVGSNGAGKSTLFGAIAGSFYTDEGRILLDGTDLTFQPEHQRSRVIGRLFQDPMRGTAPHMTIEENLALAYLRASHGSPFRRITPKDRELFRSQLAQLDMGLEERFLVSFCTISAPAAVRASLMWSLRSSKSTLLHRRPQISSRRRPRLPASLTISSSTLSAVAGSSAAVCSSSSSSFGGTMVAISSVSACR